jgi:hypothetical protein
MKAIILATVAIVVVAVAVTITFRRVPRARGVGTMLKVFVGFGPMLVVAWTATPDDLGFLPPAMLAEPRWVDLAGCLFFYGAAFFGGLLQLYNLADRGLSLQILAELRAASDRALTADEIAERYSNGRGLLWMYARRLDGLIRVGVVVVDGDVVRLTARGRAWAKRFAGLRRFFHLSPC